MINENAVKIRFMECKMAGQSYKFVLQTTHPQYLYQVLEFKETWSNIGNLLNLMLLKMKSIVRLVLG